ncbi:hypothetical protein FQN57_005421 [Myotisia sp. PD_48]|nr:hypothetical protein FQN57_005421 [Myotisia sp. PD_48]
MAADIRAWEAQFKDNGASFFFITTLADPSILLPQDNMSMAYYIAAQSPKLKYLSKVLLDTVLIKGERLIVFTRWPMCQWVTVMFVKSERHLCTDCRRHAGCPKSEVSHPDSDGDKVEEIIDRYPELDVAMVRPLYFLLTEWVAATAIQYGLKGLMKGWIALKSNGSTAGLCMRALTPTNANQSTNSLYFEAEPPKQLTECRELVPGSQFEVDAMSTGLLSFLYLGVTMEDRIRPPATPLWPPLYSPIDSVIGNFFRDLSPLPTISSVAQQIAEQSEENHNRQRGLERRRRARAEPRGTSATPRHEAYQSWKAIEKLWNPFFDENIPNVPEAEIVEIKFEGRNRANPTLNAGHILITTETQNYLSSKGLQEPTAFHVDPSVETVKSKRVIVDSTGREFKNWRYATARAWSENINSTDKVCLDSGCTMSLVIEEAASAARLASETTPIISNGPFNQNGM